MIRIIIATAVGICAGSVAATFGSKADNEFREFVPPEPVGTAQTQCFHGSSLEAARISEREVTESLLVEIDRLESEIQRLSATAPDPLGGQAWVRDAWAELTADEAAIDRRQQLIDGSFDPSRAAWMAEREYELEMAVSNDHDRLMPLDHLETRLLARQALRAEIGDYEYEQFLRATGQSTAVAVMQVIPDSPAAIGGLRTGDEIVDYDGERVFNVLELSEASGDGQPGESVIVNIERDGMPMQLVLPRGALGISAGRSGR